jgi:hypothetical protein
VLYAVQRGSKIALKAAENSSQSPILDAAHIWAPGRWEPKKVGSSYVLYAVQRQRESKTASKAA